MFTHPQVRQGSILFRSDAVRAVINANKAYIIKVKVNRVSHDRMYIQPGEPGHDAPYVGKHLT
jgi:hypothetical protein